MSNSIYLGGMSSYYNSFIQSAQNRRSSGTKVTENQIGASETKKDFLEAVREKASVSSTTKVSKTISTKDMTLDEYKNYIKGQISSFKWCSDKIGDSCSINISDEGFKAMQNDQEYEKWVLNDLKTAFATPMPGWTRSIGGTRYQVVHYGATKEECHSTSWWTGYQGGKGKEIWEEKSEGAFWSSRADRKEMQERLEEKVYARKLEQQELMEEYIGEQIRYRKEMNQYFKAMHYKKGFTTADMGNIAFENSGTSASVASAAYEANFMISGIMGNL